MSIKAIPTIPADQQADLMKNGLLAQPDQMWRSPCGRFLLEARKPGAKHRRRVNLGASSQ
jgi:hypothetical protein